MSLVAALALAAACGGVDDSEFDFDAFAREVDAAAERAERRDDCAAALPAEPAATARGEILEFVAAIFLVPADSLTSEQQTCGSDPHTVPCAAYFMNDVFHSNGSMGTELRPLADQVEGVAADVELVVWSPTQGAATGPAISLAGIEDGRLLGLVYVIGTTRCAP